MTQFAAVDRIKANRAEQQRINSLTSDADKQQARSALNQAGNEVVYETMKRHLTRAVESPSQLREQMTWFWMNHFSVFQGKANVRWTLAEYEETVRAHALGKFSDLVVATSHVARDARVSGQRPERCGQDQRELRARADGAAHARRQRWPKWVALHADGCAGTCSRADWCRRELHRRRAKLHARAAAALRSQRSLRVQPGAARFQQQDGARRAHQRR